jgi:hypothetical protein
MRDTQPATPAIAPDYPDTANRATEMGWAEGRLSDGRPWMASLWEDEEGDRTLSLAFAAEAGEALAEEDIKGSLQKTEFKAR